MLWCLAFGWRCLRSIAPDFGLKFRFRHPALVAFVDSVGFDAFRTLVVLIEMVGLVGFEVVDVAASGSRHLLQVLLPLQDFSLLFCLVFQLFFNGKLF